MINYKKIVTLNQKNNTVIFLNTSIVVIKKIKIFTIIYIATFIMLKSNFSNENNTNGKLCSFF